MIRPQEWRFTTDISAKDLKAGINLPALAGFSFNWKARKCSIARP
jgi:hypothetical protein